VGRSQYLVKYSLRAKAKVAGLSAVENGLDSSPMSRHLGYSLDKRASKQQSWTEKEMGRLISDS
jgi:hypothetical protein